MLNKDGQRELAYVVIIDAIQPIEGYDRVETAIVGGWHVIVQKNQFKPGDPAIYFEIDSKVPKDKECFAFLEKRNYRIKTLKMCKTISQGLLMHAEDFGWKVLPATLSIDGYTDIEACIIDDKNIPHYATDESRFLTKELGVTYADLEDNLRKAPSVDKYKKMAQRHPAIFRKPFVRWVMKRQWGKDLMFLFFGKKKDKKNGWPTWVSKTDEERIQNMPWILTDGGNWIATEKIDGSSTTFTMKRGKRGKNEFYVCSRNVCFDSIDKPCYYDTNIYWEMAQKYDMYNVLSKMLKDFPEEDWITIQGETYGAGVQKRDYSLNFHDFVAFNLIMSSCGRFGSLKMQETLIKYRVPVVPILGITKINIFEDVDAILAYAEGNSKIDNKPREGIVFRSWNGEKSFKVVSNAYLLKYHS